MSQICYPSLKLLITFSVNSSMWHRTALTSGITFTLLTNIGVFDLFLRAIWRAGLFSVKLIGAPENILSLLSSTFLTLA